MLFIRQTPNELVTFNIYIRVQVARSTGRRNQWPNCPSKEGDCSRIASGMCLYQSNAASLLSRYDAVLFSRSLWFLSPRERRDYISNNGAPQAAKPYRDKRIYSLLQNFFFFFFSPQHRQRRRRRSAARYPRHIQHS